MRTPPTPRTLEPVEADVGVQRVAAPAGGRCWICGMTAVAGERLPGRRSRTRLLCRRHDRLVFGGPRDDDPE